MGAMSIGTEVAVVVSIALMSLVVVWPAGRICGGIATWSRFGSFANREPLLIVVCSAGRMAARDKLQMKNALIASSRLVSLWLRGPL